MTRGQPRKSIVAGVETSDLASQPLHIPMRSKIVFAEITWGGYIQNSDLVGQTGAISAQSA